MPENKIPTARPPVSRMKFNLNLESVVMLKNKSS
jgi:hypothetical protein